MVVVVMSQNFKQVATGSCLRKNIEIAMISYIMGSFYMTSPLG